MIILKFLKIFFTTQKAKRNLMNYAKQMKKQCNFRNRVMETICPDLKLLTKKDKERLKYLPSIKRIQEEIDKIITGKKSELEAP